METGDIKVRGKEEEEDDKAEVDIWNYTFGYVKMAVVKCAIELGIADAIDNHAGPMTLSELTTTLKCESSRFSRIMRFLVHYQIFKEEPITRDSVGFALTPLSRRLIRHGERSMAPLILLESSPVMLAPWHSLSAHVLGNGNSPFEKLLHDWDDEECIKILKKCREAIPRDRGKIIIIQSVIEEDKDDKLEFVRLMLDMVMMAHTSKGRERTLQQWEYVLGEAGFTRFNVKRIRAVQSVIEVYV
ncbi:hypothetical protein V6N13_122247 [Hibiscus sabdariffa]